VIDGQDRGCAGSIDHFFSHTFAFFVFPSCYSSELWAWRACFPPLLSTTATLSDFSHLILIFIFSRFPLRVGSETQKAGGADVRLRSLRVVLSV
jgi:hypothetical protein